MVPKSYRPAFVDLLASTYGSNILDPYYKPLDDIKEGYAKTNLQGVNLGVLALYKLSSIFSADIAYNYNRSYDETNILWGQNSYYMRDLINQYTTPGTIFTRNIPVGGIYKPSFTKSNNQVLKAKLNINKSWNDKNIINAIAGMDVSQYYSFLQIHSYYGYDENTLAVNNNLSYKTNVRRLFGDPDIGIPVALVPFYSPTLVDLKIRTYALYSNAAYTYDRRYTISGSVRKDISSEFGSGTNRGGTPFYSLGTSWNIANEKFYQLLWLPKLQLRATFGYNGNVNPRIGSRAILSVPPKQNAVSGLFSSDISDTQGVPNRDLRPEKTGVLNFGLDFGLRNNRLSGSLEYYEKRTSDLLTTAPMDPSTGFSILNINTANLIGRGIDLTLNSQNIQSGLFSWTSNFNFSYNRVKVTKLYVGESTTALQALSSSSFNTGADLSRLYGFKWAGLDPNTGDPRGYLNGQVVSLTSATAGTVYTSISNAPASTAHYFGRRFRYTLVLWIMYLAMVVSRSVQTYFLNLAIILEDHQQMLFLILKCIIPMYYKVQSITRGGKSPEMNCIQTFLL
ncbi:hypothetical protein [Pedobacter sp. NJ-S-72]